MGITAKILQEDTAHSSRCSNPQEDRHESIRVRFRKPLDIEQEMCNDCVNYLTYAQLYNSAYRARDRDVWMTQMISISKRGCLRLRRRMTANMKQMADTQMIMQDRLQWKTHLRLFEQSALVHKMVLIRTRRLSRMMLRHTYRPIYGRMFARTVKAIYAPDDTNSADSNTVLVRAESENVDCAA